MKSTERKIIDKRSPRARALAVIAAHRTAQPGADIAIYKGHARSGKDGPRVGAVIVEIDGKPHPLTSEEARILAGIYEEAMRTFAAPPEFPDMILGLRASADKADQEVEAA